MSSRPERSGHLSGAGVALDDLDQVITALRDAATTTPRESQIQARHLDEQADQRVIDEAIALRNSLEQHLQQTDLDEVIPDVNVAITALKDALAATPPEPPVHRYNLELPPLPHLEHVARRANLPEVIAALNDAVAPSPGAIPIPEQRQETLLEQKRESPRLGPSKPQGTPPK